jgi:hypothetical protein
MLSAVWPSGRLAERQPFDATLHPAFARLADPIFAMLIGVRTAYERKQSRHKRKCELSAHEHRTVGPTRRG